MKAFLMMGQSNMSGRGNVHDLPEIISENVRVWRDGAWQPAREPVVIDKPAYAGAGMGPAFGVAVSMLTGEETGLIPCSLGGSGMDQWTPGGELFENAVKLAVQAMESGAVLSGILWHQGETDGSFVESALMYAKHLRIMMDAMTQRLQQAAADAGAADRLLLPLPVITGELGDYLDYHATCLYHRVINQQLHAFAALKPEYACVKAADLADKGDALHFSALSQRRLGLRYANAWMDTFLRLTAQQQGRTEMRTEYV